MKIHVVGINYEPETVAVFNTEMCEYLNRKGHDVTVFTAFPNYPQWKIYEGYEGKLFKDEQLNGVTIKRSYIYVPHKVNSISRIFFEASFIVSSFLRLLFTRSPNLIFVISAPIGLGITAFLISRLKDIPFIFHVKDLQPDTAVNLKMLNNKWIINFLFLIEKFIYQKALVVSTISAGMVKKIISKGIDVNKVLLFKDWVDIERFKPSNKVNSFSIRNKLSDKFVVSYCGNFGIKQGLELILQVAKDTRSFSEIVYLLVGDGVAKDTLFRMSNEMDLNNVKFLPPQNHETYSQVLSTSDICLIIQKSQVKDVLIPSKFLHITASGRPVISTAVKGSEAFNQIKLANCGISVKPENVVELKEAILRLKEDPLLRNELGRNGRVHAENNLAKNKILNSFHSKIIKLSHCKKLYT